jgi:hypothetical protein
MHEKNLDGKQLVKKGMAAQNNMPAMPIESGGY